MRKTILFFILAIVFGVTGCALLDPHTATDGTVTTTLTDIMGQAGAAAQGVSMFWPIAAPIGGLLTLLAGGILKIVSLGKKNSKLGTALTAVVEGVNVYSADEARIKELMVDAGADKEKVDVVFGKASKIKHMIQVFANERNIEAFLKLFIKTAEAKEGI